jgi:hypothetical protein
MDPRRLSGNKLVVGSQARILYADGKSQKIAETFNQLSVEISAQLCGSWFSHDVSGTDSPFRNNIYDGSKFYRYGHSWRYRDNFRSPLGFLSMVVASAGVKSSMTGFGMLLDLQMTPQELKNLLFYLT